MKKEVGTALSVGGSVLREEEEKTVCPVNTQAVKKEETPVCSVGLTVLGEEYRAASPVSIPAVLKKEGQTLHPVAQTVLRGEEMTA